MAGLYKWPYSVARYFRRLREPRSLGIARTDLVLDLGSGQDPHPRANILCDKFISDSSERAGRLGMVVDRPLVVADATRTPFPDKSFDYVICSHLLEHMDDPGALLHEIQRIGRAGYIETPSPVYEKLWGWPFHRWYIRSVGGTLILKAKDQPLFDRELHDWFSRHIEKRRMWTLFIPHLDRWNLVTTFRWRDRFDFSVDGAIPTDTFQSARVAEDVAPEPVIQHKSLTSTIKSGVARATRRRSDDRVSDVLSRLRCPTCTGELKVESGRRICAGCGRIYAIEGHVHTLLADQ